MQLQPRPLKAFFHASFRALSAAARSVGAAGGGWALVAATRAATATSSAKDESQEREAVLGDGPVPRHIAVIMDGNRRYGKREYGNTLQGHRSGGEKLRDFMEWCVEAGVDALTVFAFSTENWKRDPQEVDAMMQLFVTEVPQLEEKTVKLNVRVHFLCSDSQRIPPEVRKATKNLEEQTSGCTGLQLNICLSYGGRSDVVCACRQIAQDVAAGKLDVDSIDEALVSKNLLTAHVPDPDVLIRTSGEFRISNFLVYQVAYAEMFFIDKHWPEVTHSDFIKVIHDFRKRGRRFGK